MHVVAALRSYKTDDESFWNEESKGENAESDNHDEESDVDEDGESSLMFVDHVEEDLRTWPRSSQVFLRKSFVQELTALMRIDTVGPILSQSFEDGSTDDQSLWQPASAEAAHALVKRFVEQCTLCFQLERERIGYWDAEKMADEDSDSGWFNYSEDENSETDSNSDASDSSQSRKSE